MQLVLDRFGRVVLPKGIRDDLGLAPGDVLDVDEQTECLVLRPARESSPLRAKDGLLVFAGRSTGDLRAAVTEHRRARIGRAAAMRKRP
jgi:AbrB family looped-hinge helix DNA binding protein